MAWEFDLVSLGLHCFLRLSSAGLLVVLIPGCCWAYSAFCNTRSCAHEHLATRRRTPYLWGACELHTNTWPHVDAHLTSDRRWGACELHRNDATVHLRLCLLAVGADCSCLARRAIMSEPA